MSVQKVDTRRSNSNPSLPALNPRMRSSDRNTLQQLLKEELRMTIMAKRHARGEGEIRVEFHEPESHELTQAERERKERRREQNRRAAQRCRKKKRMSQMSVLQNYEWIITRNQQLQQEVEQLRQETVLLQSALQSHRDTCTCTHAHKGSLLPLAPKVKVEPRDDSSPTAHVGYGTPSPPASSSSSSCSVSLSSSSTGSAACQYGGGRESVMACDSNASTVQQQQPQQQQQQQHSFGGLQPRSYQAMSDTSCSFPTATTCSSSGGGGAPGRGNNNNNNNYGPPIHPHPHHGLVPFGNHNHHHQTELLGGSLGESPDMQVAAVPSHDRDRLHFHRGASSFSTSASTALPFGSDLMGEAATSQSRHLPSAPHGHGGLGGRGGAGTGGGGPLTLLEELAYMPGGLRSCVFQEEAATPLSADGRHSISSVSSDVSAASPEQQLGGRDVLRATEEEGRADDVTMGDYVTDDDATPDDVSQLLSQINQNDLIFQQDAGMDDVFSDSVANMSGLPEHFLQNI